MRRPILNLFILIFHIVVFSHGKSFSTIKIGANGGYHGIVVSIAESVPYDDCDDILNNLETALADASAFLHNALEGRAHFKEISILFPHSWKEDCGRSVTAAAGELSQYADLRIAVPHLLFPDVPWTQQSQGCGQPGDFISMSFTSLVNPSHRGELGRALVREWAKLRYGVFDESGIPGDPVYPPCYHDELDGAARVSGCADVRLDSAGLCENVTQLLLSGDTESLTPLLVHPEATSSIMFAHTAPQITKFCEESTHNRYAPTKHNAICNRRSVTDVILKHSDFAKRSSEVPSGTITPHMSYKRELLTRYVLVIEETNDMLLRESWSFLRLAVRKFAVHDLSTGTELGVVSVNATGSTRLQRIISLSSATRDAVASSMPFSPGDGSVHKTKQEASSCLPCGLKEALNMLEDSNQGGRAPAASVVIVIAPGTGRLGELLSMSDRALRLNARIATINFPQLARSTHSALDTLAHATGGLAFTVLERRQNIDSSYLNTYFELTQSMLAIRDHFSQDGVAKLPVEIHRRQLTDDGRSRITGSFVVGPGLGEPSQFAVYLHNSDNPLLRSVTLTSPAQHVYNARSDQLLNLKMFTLNAAINETGTWTYMIERYPGNPQPNFVVVSATPQSASQEDAPVRARAGTSSSTHYLDANSSPFVIYAEVKQGDWPVLGAKVEVKVTKASNESNSPFNERFELLDTGSGDPDITRGDGIYSRYFLGYSHALGGPGLYQFDIEVTDNGNTAYTWQSTRGTLGRRSIMDDELNGNSQWTVINTASGRCCGSAIWPQAVRPLPPFQRILPSMTVEVGIGAAQHALDLPPGHVADLRLQPSVALNDMKARLTWTSPGKNGDVGTVDHYEVRYSDSLKSLIDDFESANIWTNGSPFPLAAGADMSFTLDMSEMPELLDRPLFVALRAFDPSGLGSPISNAVRILVATPPRIPTPPDAAFPDNYPEPAVVPHLSTTSGPGMILQVVLPIVAGAVVLAVCLGLYCVIVIRRHKKKSKASQQSSNSNANSSVPSNTPLPYSEPAPSYDVSEEKMYYTLPLQSTHAPAQQISIIGGRNLSPYQSWTASQLLHEHERRHSPYVYPPEYHESPEDCLQEPPVPPLPHESSVYGMNYHNSSYITSPDEMSYETYAQRIQYKMPPPTLPKPIMDSFNSSLQGSLSSVNSDKKKRNVTMV